MILVTGANGQLGRAIVEHLIERVPAEEIGVSVREPEKARGLEEQGVRVRRGDFEDAESLAHAFEGASRVLIVSVDSTGEAAVRRHRAAIEAAKTAGAERIFYTSHAGSDPISAFPPMVDHAATEATLRESGMAYTSLRNGFYATTAVMQMMGALETGELAVPEDGPVDWTTHSDLAEATAIALSDGGLADTVLNLTGAEAVDMAGIAAIASGLTGRPIRRVVVPDEEYRSGLIARGLPEHAADMLLGIFLASRQRRFTLLDPTLGRAHRPTADAPAGSPEGGDHGRRPMSAPARGWKSSPRRSSRSRRPLAPASAGQGSAPSCSRARSLRPCVSLFMAAG